MQPRTCASGCPAQARSSAAASCRRTQAHSAAGPSAAAGASVMHSTCASPACRSWPAAAVLSAMVLEPNPKPCRSSSQAACCGGARPAPGSRGAAELPAAGAVERAPALTRVRPAGLPSIAQDQAPGAALATASSTISARRRSVPAGKPLLTTTAGYAILLVTKR